MPQNVWRGMKMTIVPKFSQICKIISNNFENGLLEQITINLSTWLEI